MNKDSNREPEWFRWPKNVKRIVILHNPRSLYDDKILRESKILKVRKLHIPVLKYKRLYHEKTNITCIHLGIHRKIKLGLTHRKQPMKYNGILMPQIMVEKNGKRKTRICILRDWMLNKQNIPILSTITVNAFL